MDETPPAAPKPATPPPRPLGAPADIVRPTGRAAPPGGPTPPLPPPAGGPRPKDNSVAIGVGLAFGLIPAVLATFWLSDLAYRAFGYGFIGGTVLQVIPLGYIVAVHAFALMVKRPRILAGFWIAALIGAAVFVISCFALVWYAFGNS